MTKLVYICENVKCKKEFTVNQKHSYPKECPYCSCKDIVKIRTINKIIIDKKKGK